MLDLEKNKGRYYVGIEGIDESKIIDFYHDDDEVPIARYCIPLRELMEIPPRIKKIGSSEELTVEEFLKIKK